MTDNEIINIGDVCTYSFGDKNKSLSIVEVVAELQDENIVVIKFHQVIVDDSGNGIFTYLCNEGKTMNVSKKYLTKIDLINRQKAQINGLQDEVIIKTDMLNEQKAKIERLKHILINFMCEVENWEHKHNIDTSNIPKIAVLGTEKENIIKQIKSEAIKEFWGKLRAYMNNIIIEVSGYSKAKTFVSYGDNLVKEMTEKNDKE